MCIFQATDPDDAFRQGRAWKIYIFVSNFLFFKVFWLIPKDSERFFRVLYESFGINTKSLKTKKLNGKNHFLKFSNKKGTFVYF